MRGAPSLVVLGVRDEVRLEGLADDLGREGLSVTRFHEPDLGGALTALALVVRGESRALRRLPLLFRDVERG